MNSHYNTRIHKDPNVISLHMYIFKNYLDLILLYFIFCFSIRKTSDCKQGALRFLLCFPF